MTTQLIIDRSAAIWNIPPEAITGSRRSLSVVRARRLAMFLAREITEATYAEIGESFGKDHGTVIHACRVLERQLKQSPSGIEAVRCRGAMRGLSPSASARYPVLTHIAV